ncbi:beta-ketoacyl synthase [Streptomyces laurentii]|uniref:Beta-ketoacyl synthase n=1 Tax=Streptomyces laurentii TaxID=39478 RepID=A0A169PJZ8_STRLU|nr:beta-ketoacyl synthase [Streptomyces laurentii]
MSQQHHGPDQQREQDQDLDRIAVVGMAGRFPGADDVDGFWDGLTQGREGITVLTEEELVASGVDPGTAGHDGYVGAKGSLAGADLFDEKFFGYSPREAELLDPQHRVFLECAWHALESAGVDPGRFEGRIGVFAGAGLNTYLLSNLMNNQQVLDASGMYQVMLASDKDFLATRAAYKLGLKGPAITVQTACSTSLTAVHLASQSLLDGECDIALAGGVSVSSPLRGGYQYEPGGILSPDGTCRAFDADAQGTVPGNGVGIVVLRRLNDARADGDRVDAVVLASAVNNDGSLKAGYTAPSVDGQAEVIAEALALAAVSPETVGYVETHGTGTPLGDPIEIAALTRAHRAGTDAQGYCAIGSVKSNIGHLDAAAGVTGLIKAVLALRHEAIPPTLHCERPNPALELDSSPFFVNTELRPWPRAGRPRRAGVSSFGIGGTNVHVVLEEAPPEQPDRPARTPEDGDTPVRLLPLSAKSGPALAEAAGLLADRLEGDAGVDLDAVAHTLAQRRTPFAHRATVVARSTGEAVTALRRLARSAPAARATASDDAPVAFLFPGQGAQYPGMARDLYARGGVFAEEFDRCAELFAPHLGEDLRALVFADDSANTADRLRRTRFAQPALFSVEFALARLWQSWGATPRAMAGHSIGEYVAACLAGVFTLRDAARLVAARGRLVQEMAPGAMLSVFLSGQETSARLGEGEDLTIAAVNSTELTVVSGPVEAIDALQRRLGAEGVGCRRLHTSHAFHSPAMDAAVVPFVDLVRTVTLSVPEVPFLSNVTGTWITDEQATDPEYWGTHLRRPVRFRDALGALLADPGLVLLEVGPGQNLANFARAHGDWSTSRTVVGSLRHPGEDVTDDAHLLAQLGAAWAVGVAVDWEALQGPARHRPVRLPGYPFQRRRYWVEATDRAHGSRPAVTSQDGWFSTPGWQRLTLPAPSAGTGDTWVVLGAGLPLGDALADRLERDGDPVVRVGAGTAREQTGPNSWTLDPADSDHLSALTRSLALPPLTDGGGRRLRFVHLWSTADGDMEPSAPDAQRLDAARRTGFDSLLALAQALGAEKPAVPVTVDVLCHGVYDVTGDEPLLPEHALLLGAATVIPQETSGTACRILDLTRAALDTPGEDAVRAVLAALAQDGGGTEFALRGRHLWARGFDQVGWIAPAPAGGTEHTGLRDGGVYLITGGLGGLGLALAEQIASTADRPALGLLGRSGFPAPADWDAHLREHDDGDAVSIRIRRLRHLESLGARVLVLRADVTDEKQMRRAVEELRDAAGPLNGVVHAAGLPSQGLIITKSPADAGEVLAAKTHGLIVLDTVCGAEDLDFLLLCSSVSAVLGGPGQSDYAAANAFLDAWAQHKRRAGLPVTSVGWDTWRNVGMAAGLENRFGLDSGTPLTGHPLLRRLVQSTSTSRTYATVFSTEESWIVGDHRIQEHGLVPGTAYLELVRAAVAEQAGGRDIEIGDVQYMVPVVVPDGRIREVFTTVEERDGNWSFAVRSKSGSPESVTWTDHARGSVTFHEPAPRVVRDLAELRDRCQATEVLDTDESIKLGLGLDRFEKGGPIEFSFGPRWRCMKEILVGPDRVMATLRLDEEFHGDLDHYLLHPALLDAAGGTARVHAPDTYYLPFSYRSLRAFHGLTSTVHAYVEVKGATDSAGETSTCDIELLAPDGLLLARIGDFTIKRINDPEGLGRQILDAVVAPEADEAGVQGHGGVLRTLAEGISEQQGQDVFARLLATPGLPAHLVVSRRDLAELRELARSLTPELLEQEMGQLSLPGGSHPRPDLDTPYVAPRTSREREIAEVWQEVLGLDRVGVDDDFFALGGHSLGAVQISTRLTSRLGVELDLRAFFEQPTVAYTAGLLEAGAGAPPRAESVIEVLSRDEPEPGVDLERLSELSDDEVEAALLRLLASDGAHQDQEDTE